MSNRIKVFGLSVIMALVVALAFGEKIFAIPTVVLDDFNDGDTTTQNPIEPKSRSWTFSYEGTPRNDLGTEAGAAPAGDTAVRWEPKGVNHYNWIAGLKDFATAFDHVHKSPSWQIRWDECWYANNYDGDTVAVGEDLYESTPVVTIYYNVYTELGAEGFSMKLSRRSEQEDTYGEVFYGETGIGNKSIDWPDGFNPLTDEGDPKCYGYYLRRNLDCEITVVAVTLDSSGEEGNTVYELYGDTWCQAGQTINGYPVSDDSYELTAIEFTAAQTDDGFDAHQDNIEVLSLANDWGDTHPANFDHYVDLREFERLGDGNTSLSVSGTSGDTAINEAVRYCTHIYIPFNHREGTSYTWPHFVGNPLIIDRDYPLFFVGMSRLTSRLVPLDQTGYMPPMFEIKNAPIVNFTNLNLSMGYGDTIDFRSVIITDGNTNDVRFELLNCFVKESVVDIKGGTTAIFQGTYFGPSGQVYSPILLDHDSAELWYTGGDIDDGTPQVSDWNSVHHIWQKKGRLAVYGISVEGQVGRGSFRIESPARTGTGWPHVIAGVRSEGTNRWHKDTAQDNYPASMLYVPYTTSDVDIIFKTNSGSYGYPDASLGVNSFADYNAAGNLWMIGNNSRYTVNTMVKGNTDAATMVAFGNIVHGNTACDDYTYTCTGANCVLDAATCVYTGDGDTFVCDGRTCNCPPSQGTCSCDGNTCDRIDNKLYCYGCHTYKSPCIMSGPTCTDGYTLSITSCDADTCPSSSEECSCPPNSWCYCCIDDYQCTSKNDELMCVSDNFHFRSLFGDSLLGSDTIHAGNMYDWKHLSGSGETYWGCPATPQVRIIDPSYPIPGEPLSVTLDDYDTTIPDIPDTPIPENIKLSLPRMNFALPDMVDVREFEGATVVGDGTVDDTVAIQEILDSETVRGRIFFPAGTYRTTTPLGYHNSQYGNANFKDADGWIAGAGSTVTKIARDVIDGSTGSVVLTDHLAYFTVSGITFETVKFGDSISFEEEGNTVVLEGNTAVYWPNFNIEWKDYDEWSVCSQAAMFHDCVFSGGKYGLGIGLKYETGSSENCVHNMMMIDNEFKNAKFGLGVGHFNALCNTVIDGTFKDNLIAMSNGYDEGEAIAGTWHVIRALLEDTQVRDFHVDGSASATRYWYGIKSYSSPREFNTSGWSTVEYPLIFDGCSISPGTTAGYDFYSAQGGGFIFLHSDLDPIQGNSVMWIKGNSGTNNYGFKLHSTIPDWQYIKVGNRSRAFELE
jgi:hypothetical protein